ncbi:MAG: hypothetical protein ACYTEW_25830, partial [Planctomycetota bacterium]
MGQIIIGLAPVESAGTGSGMPPALILREQQSNVYAAISVKNAVTDIDHDLFIFSGVITYPNMNKYFRVQGIHQKP